MTSLNVTAARQSSHFHMAGKKGIVCTLRCTQHIMITWISLWPTGAWWNYYRVHLWKPLFCICDTLFKSHHRQTLLHCVFLQTSIKRIVWNWTWTWTCLVLNCAERFYKVSSDLGVWKKWHWEKVCTLGPVVEGIFFFLFSLFLSFSVDVGKCCDPENRCMWLHRQGLNPQTTLWSEELLQKKIHKFSFIRQTVCDAGHLDSPWLALLHAHQLRGKVQNDKIPNQFTCLQELYQPVAVFL